MRTGSLEGATGLLACESRSRARYISMSDAVLLVPGAGAAGTGSAGFVGSDGAGDPRAPFAAEAAEAAAAQGAFWPMHDALYAGRGALADADLVEHARVLGLDANRVAAELASGAHAERVARDAASARAAGLSSTPAFFVNGELYADSYDAGSLVEALGGS